MFAHDRNQTREIQIAIKWQAVVECLAPFHQLFWLVECRTICKNTSAASIKQLITGEVILYILVQTSHEFLEQLSGYLTVIVNGYPDNKRQDPFQSYFQFPFTQEVHDIWYPERAIIKLLILFASCTKWPNSES